MKIVITGKPEEIVNLFRETAKKIMTKAAMEYAKEAGEREGKPQEFSGTKIIM